MTNTVEKLLAALSLPSPHYSYCQKAKLLCWTYAQEQAGANRLSADVEPDQIRSTRFRDAELQL
jgi:hypothetical protein